MTLSKGNLLKAVLLGTMAVPMLTIAAMGQQEVDPTYYDPWAPTVKTVVHANATTPKPMAGKIKKQNTTTAARTKGKKTQVEAARRSDETRSIASAQPIR